jgi:hypothetical protein
MKLPSFFQLCTIALVFIKVIAAPVLRNKNYSLAIKVGAMVQRLDQSRGNDDQHLWRSDDQRLDLSTPCSFCRPHLLMMTTSKLMAMMPNASHSIKIQHAN